MTARLHDIFNQTVPPAMLVLVALRERDGDRQVMLVLTDSDDAEVPDRFDLPVAQVYSDDDMLPVAGAFVDLYIWDPTWRERFHFHRLVTKDGVNQVWLVHVVESEADHKTWYSLDDLPTGLALEDARVLDYVKTQLNK